MRLRSHRPRPKPSLFLRVNKSATDKNSSCKFFSLVACCRPEPHRDSGSHGTIDSCFRLECRLKGRHPHIIDRAIALQAVFRQNGFRWGRVYGNRHLFGVVKLNIPLRCCKYSLDLFAELSGFRQAGMNDDKLKEKLLSKSSLEPGDFALIDGQLRGVFEAFGVGA